MGTISFEKRGRKIGRKVNFHQVIIDGTVQFLNTIKSHKEEYVELRDFLTKVGLMGDTKINMVVVLGLNKKLVDSLPSQILNQLTTSGVDITQLKAIPVMNIPFITYGGKVRSIEYTTILPYPEIEVGEELKNQIFGVYCGNSLKKYIQRLVEDPILSQSLLPVVITDIPSNYIFEPLFPDIVNVISLL